MDVSTDRAVSASQGVMRIAQVAAAYLLVALFVAGVADIGLRAVRFTLSGRIANPRAIIGLLDGVLLLFVIVELYQTVVAYSERSEEIAVVRTAIFAGIIAMIRKAILFRTGDYRTPLDALAAASAYMIVLLGLSVVLFVSYRYARP